MALKTKSLFGFFVLSALSGYVMALEEADDAAQAGRPCLKRSETNNIAAKPNLV